MYKEMINDQNKTKAQLMAELAEMRQRVAELGTLTEAAERIAELQANNKHLQQTVIEHQQVQATLWESRQFLQSTLDALSAHMAILDETGAIIAVNAAWRRFAEGNGLSGVTYGLGLNYLEICETAQGDGSKDAWIAAAGIRAVIAKQSNEFCLEYACPSPTEKRWFLMRVTRFESDRQIWAVVTHENITERKQAEEALAQSEVRFRTMVQNSSDIFTIFEADGAIRYGSPSIKQILGYKPEALIGRNTFDYIHPEDVATVRAAFENQVKQSGLTEPIEFRFRHADGSWVYLEAISSNLLGDPRIKGLVVNSRDISERKRTEKALQESEARFRRLAENVPDIIYRYSYVPTPGYNYISPAITTITGYTPEELYTDSRWWLKLIHRDDLEAVQRWIFNRQAWPQPCVARLVHKEGRIIWVEFRRTPVYDEAGNLVATDGIARDITEQKEAETERESLLAAEREQRLLAETLTEVVMALTAQTSLAAVLDEILQQVHRVVPYTTANIALLEANTLRVVRHQGYTAFQSENFLADLVQSLDQTLVDAEIIRSQQPLIIPDTRQEPHWITFEETRWIRSYMGIPICLQDRSLGMLRLDAAAPNEFSARDIQRLEPLTSAAAIALENAHLYDQARQELAERKRAEEEREKLIVELQEALAKVKTLHGLIPICASCKKIRNDQGYWTQVEVYIKEHSEAEFSHGVCPDCMRKLYSEFYQNDEQSIC